MGTIKQWKTQTKSGTCRLLQVLLSGEQLNSTAIAVREARTVDQETLYDRTFTSGHLPKTASSL